MDQPLETFELHERLGKSMFSNGVTPDNIYRIVKALEGLVEEIRELNTRLARA